MSLINVKSNSVGCHEAALNSEANSAQCCPVPVEEVSLMNGFQDKTTGLGTAGHQ